MVDQIALAALVADADKRLSAVAANASKVMNDLFTGRDPGMSYLLGSYFNSTRVTAPWVHPDISANLFQARLMELVIDLIPGMPKVLVKAMTPEAAGYEEDQNFLSNWGSRFGELKDCLRKVAMYGPMGTHVGVRLKVDESAPLHKRFKYCPLSHTECGYEPGLRRFVWHKFSEASSADPQVIKEITEVFWSNEHDTACTVYRYEQDTDGEGLGQFVGSKKLDGACPVRIRSFLEAPPGEDIPPIECVSWVPLIRAIQDTLEAIDREVGSVNNVILYDQDKISEEEVSAIRSNKVGNTVYVPVNSTGGLGTTDSGVSHVMRPVERSSALGELVATLQQYIELLDDVIGTSPLERGAAVGPRKSAAEASILSNASSRRTKNRLSVIAELIADIEQTKYTWQRAAYGETVTVPVGGGIDRIVRVADPSAAQMTFQVDVVELGNLSKQGQIETYAAATSIVGSTLAQFQGEAPPAVKESLRRYLHALGAEDIAQFIEDPVLAGGPKERYIKFLKNPSVGLPVDPNDPPEPFLVYYNQQIQDPDTPDKAKVELQRAINQYQRRQQEAQAAQQPAPQAGVSPLGAPQQALPTGDIPLI